MNRRAFFASLFGGGSLAAVASINNPYPSGGYIAKSAGTVYIRNCNCSVLSKSQVEKLINQAMRSARVSGAKI
jgi:hypothetical protein